MAAMNVPIPSASLPLRVEWGVAAKAFPGQRESGDLYLVEEIPEGWLFAVVDGLGHGEEAATAARAIIAIIKSHASASLISLFRLCHDGLKETRGVVMSLAVLNQRDSTLTWMGVGNVEGVLRLSDPANELHREFLILRGGVVGYHLPQLLSTTLPIKAGDTMALYTDGIRVDYTVPLLSLHDAAQAQADRILATRGIDSDDALILVARFNGADA